ncbi:hypothetical protein ACQCVH_11415 [Bacillus infantis]|jgi:hypothetical protein|uniref:hypothetical protein n=1 Tax=Bacillus infantis TaxID=324767 RepID=UPI000B9C4C1E|nr:hypothetical protein [Bacillus infantis]MCK6207085.1 hypothetical protein [Bacillus infantis]OXT15142.1 hypothetical protein B9K06_22815 [Bacillus sp. OG2]
MEEYLSGPTREEVLDMLESLTPKIKKSLKNTHYQDREDLEQEIKLKVLESYDKIMSLEALDFEEMFTLYLQNQDSKKEPSR